MYLKVPENMTGTDYVVGDIHGMLELLLEQLQHLNFDFQNDRLFSVGDLVDRGPRSLASFELINCPWFYAVRGNHEQFILDVADKNCPSEIHRANGGDWFYSLSQKTQDCVVEKARKLPIMLETTVDGHSVGFVHGDIQDWSQSKSSLLSLKDCDVYSDKVAQSLLWGRTKMQRKDTSFIKGINHVFLGHTPTLEVTNLGNAHFIDTAAVFGYKLTVLDIKSFLKDIYETK